MDYQEYCDYIQTHYPPRHPDLFALNEDLFAPSFLRAIHSNNPASLWKACQEIHPGVYTFDMLSLKFCRTLLEELDHFEKWMVDEDLPVIRPNTMNNYGAVLDSFGFAPFLQRMMTDYVRPMAALFYPEVGGGSLDQHHGFVVEYALDKDKSLDFHVDASDVTLNVCLGKAFEGGELFFRGIRCGRCQETAPLPGESFEIGHIPGRAILHRGNHRHGANPIKEGERYNLILWCNSSQFRHRQAKEHRREWCGWPTGEGERGT